MSRSEASADSFELVDATLVTEEEVVTAQEAEARLALQLPHLDMESQPTDLLMRWGGAVSSDEAPSAMEVSTPMPEIHPRRQKGEARRTSMEIEKAMVSRRWR